MPNPLYALSQAAVVVVILIVHLDPDGWTAASPAASEVHVDENVKS